MEKEQTIFKTEKAPKTFILALDGDVDFKPDAVLRLLERMLKNPDVGAACGRIIPKGRGKLLLKSFQILSKTFKMHIKSYNYFRFYNLLLQTHVSNIISCIPCSITLKVKNKMNFQ